MIEVNTSTVSMNAEVEIINAVGSAAMIESTIPNVAAPMTMPAIL